MKRKIVTVDCWGSILKASPAFKQTKSELVVNLFELPKGLIVNDIFKEIKSHFDYIIERTGFQPSQTLLFDTLYSYFPSKKLTSAQKKFFYQEYQNLAIQDSPTLFDEHTLPVLEDLAKDYNLILSSNTLFLSGKTLRLILRKVGIYTLFKKFNFSDEFRVSKPNHRMYSSSGFHIGDNVRTDGVGATKAGSHSIIINSNGKSIKDAYNEILYSSQI